MAKPYVIEPPKAPRARLGSEIITKLDEILNHVRGDGSTETPEGAPEVTFEANPEQLPTEATLEEEPEDETGAPGQGEGTTNPAVQKQRGGFGFPGRRLGDGER